MEIFQKTRDIIVWIIIALLVASNIFFAKEYIAILTTGNKEKLERMASEQKSKLIVGFLKLFIKNVLQVDNEVSFEDRLKLENAIRDLKDDQLFSGWQGFVDSKTSESAQKSVKNLLQLLAQKIVFK